jgi:hypothetical protein
VATADPPSKIVPTDAKEVQKLIKRAQQGDEKTLPMLQELLKETYLVELCGNIAAHAEQALLRRYSGKDLAVNEGLRRKLDSLRAELAGPTPTPLERLLVERIVTCWLHLHHLEAVYANKESMTLDLGTYYQRSLSSAQKRYLSAIKTLAVVRKLALPVLQVNIARKQVNVAGSCVASGSEGAT